MVMRRVVVSTLVILAAVVLAVVGHRPALEAQTVPEPSRVQIIDPLPVPVAPLPDTTHLGVPVNNLVNLAASPSSISSQFRGVDLSGAIDTEGFEVPPGQVLIITDLAVQTLGLSADALERVRYSLIIVSADSWIVAEIMGIRDRTGSYQRAEHYTAGLRVGPGSRLRLAAFTNGTGITMGRIQGYLVYLPVIPDPPK